MDDAQKRDLRALVKSIVRDAIATLNQGEKRKLSKLIDQSEVVHVSEPENLTAFANQIISLTQDPKMAKALEDGRVSFVPSKGRDKAPPNAAPDAAPPTPQKLSRSLTTGVVTEAVAKSLFDEGIEEIAIGNACKVTPLGREALRKYRIRTSKELS